MPNRSNHSNDGEAKDRRSVARVAIRHDFRAGDLASVLSLHDRCYLDELGFGRRFGEFVAEGLDEFGRRYDPEFDRMWIAEDGAGRPVGTVTIARVSETEAQLRWFLVSPEARGQGVGRALLEDAIAFARARGYASLFLWTLDELAAAVHVYRRAGFVLTEEHINSEWAARELREQRYELAL